MLQEILQEAKRLDRSTSWVVYQAWKKSKKFRDELQPTKFVFASKTENALSGSVPELQRTQQNRIASGDQRIKSNNSDI
jgi:hypothetical protein